MATVTYLIAPCAGGSSLNIEFSGSSLPVVGGNYYLNFTGATTDGCYEVVDTAEPATGTDGVLTLSTNYGDCITCLAANPTPTPTPTPTVTPTITSTVTPTVTKTPTITPTKTVTPTITPTPSITPTKTVTPTPSVTSTITPTPSITPTITPTTTITPTKTVTPTITSTITPTSSVTPTITPTKTVTPTVTQTPTPTTTVTPTVTKTPTPTVTPTNSPIPQSGFTADAFYEYTVDMLGSFSGGTPPAGATVPYPQFPSAKGVVAQLNAVQIGGFGGLNS